MPYHDSNYGQVFEPLRRQDPAREAIISKVAAAEVAHEADCYVVDHWAEKYRLHVVSLYSDEQLAEACEDFGLHCEETTEGKGFLYE
jgi:hypothetical protein